MIRTAIAAVTERDDRAFPLPGYQGEDTCMEALPKSAALPWHRDSLI